MSNQIFKIQREYLVTFSYFYEINNECNRDTKQNADFNTVVENVG